MKKILMYGLIVFQILIIVSLFRGIEISRKSNERIESLQDKKADLQKEKEDLLIKQKIVESEYYIEKVAREELHLSKPGETVVIVPESVTAGTMEGAAEPEMLKKKANWVRWLEILSGKI